MTHTPDESPNSLKLQRVEQLIETLGEKSPTPGGGAVASIVGALGAALARMVVNYSIGKKKLAQHDELHQEAIERLGLFAERALQLADDDAEAYGALNALMKLDKDDPKRIAAWEEAVDRAMTPPRETLGVCLGLLHLLELLDDATSKMLRSDLMIAALLAETGAQAAAINVRINLTLLEDASKVQVIEMELCRMLDVAMRLKNAIVKGGKASS
ncbi:MAG: cyclodeaminase/cyclohydrolase family protein [Planctomycetota bacterium]|nr:cyclodeaminase/cyclohydrolase family protein [Planctomycetota bacterium]